MNNYLKKSFISYLAVALGIVIGVLPMNVMALEEYSQDKKINDNILEVKTDDQKEQVLKQHWANDTINKFKEKEIIKGYNNEGVKPDNNITRAEFFTLVNRIFNFTNKEKNDFKDVVNGDWYEDSVLKAKSAGYIKGYSTDKGLIIKPNAPITREEAATIICRAFNLDESNNGVKKSFKDENEISSYSIKNIQILNSKNYISGYTDNTFKPKNKITRAEAFKMLSNVAGEIYNKPGTYNDNYEGNLIVNTKDINLKDSTIKGNLYLTEGIGEGEIILDNIKVLGKTFVNGGGENSIYAKNSDLNTVVVDKKKGKVHIVAQGKTTIKELKAESDIKINVEKESKIEKLEIQDKVKKVGIKSEGKIENVKINAKEVSINDKKVEKGTSIKIEKDEIKVENKKADNTSNTSKHSSHKSSNNSSNSNNNNNNNNNDEDKNNNNNDENKNNDNNNNNDEDKNNDNNNNNDENNDYKIINTEKSSIVETGPAVYAAVVLAKGDMDDYRFYIDQVEVQMEKVNVEGTVLKTELGNRNVKELKVVSKDGSNEEVFKFANKEIEEPLVLTDLLEKDLAVEGVEFKESDQNDGSIKNTIRLVINKDKSAKFSSKIQDGDIDSISGASLVKPSKDRVEIPGSVEIPEGLKLNVKRIDDKTLELILEGNAKVHNKEKSTKLTLVLLKDLFENTKDDFGGLKKEIDVKFNDETEDNTPDGFEIIDSKKTKIMEIQSTLYAVITLKKGTANECEFYIDGNRVEMQKVVTQGNVLKVELQNREPKKIKVINNGKEESITLN